MYRILQIQLIRQLLRTYEHLTLLFQIASESACPQRRVYDILL